MKVVLVGAFGNLGAEILKCLVAEGHEVVAAGRREKKIDGLEGKYTFFPIDVQNSESLKGLCDGADVLITTVGLTTASAELTAYDVDYQGNLNLLREAERAGVKSFNYISVIACDHADAKKVPMLHAKYLLEQELKKSGMNYVIYRPTGYFYDIVKVFRPYIEKGEMQLLRGYGSIRANVVDCPDFAHFITRHMNDANCVYEVGGKETYTYEQMAKLCFDAAGKPQNMPGLHVDDVSRITVTIVQFELIDTQKFRSFLRFDQLPVRRGKPRGRQLKISCGTLNWLQNVWKK